MKHFVVFDSIGKILRHGNCQDSTFERQAKEGEFVMEGQANDVTQKVEFDGLDENDQPINPRIIDKTPQEIEAEKPKPVEIPETERPMVVTKGQLESILKRIAALEMKT